MRRLHTGAFSALHNKFNWVLFVFVLFNYDQYEYQFYTND